MSAGWCRLPLLLAIACAPSMAQQGDAKRMPGATVEELLLLARERNPELAAQRHEAEAAVARVGPAGALPDPMLRVELENVTNYGSDAGANLLPARVGATKYTLSQSLPFWGKRDLRREVSEAEAEAVEGKAKTTWAELASRIKATYAQYYAASRLLQLNREVLELIGQLESITQVRYAGGLTPQQDAIRVQLERTATRNELVQMETDRHHLMARLNTLLGRSANAPLAEPRALRLLPGPVKLDYAALEEKLKSSNPQLFVEEARLRAAERGRDLTYRNRYPDFTVGVAPTQTRWNVNTWGVMLEMNIPLQQESRREKEREAERQLDAARARREAAATDALGVLSEALSALEAARRVETLTQGTLLPQAELTFQSALAAYENGKVDFATLLEAQRLIRRAKQDVIRAQAEQQARLADIEKLVGEDL